MPADRQTIVVPLDGSKNAERAIPVAIALAKAHGASLQFVHVLDEDDERGAPDASRATDLFKTYANGLVPQGSLVESHETAMLHGNPARAILEYASGALAIVLATHGRGGFKATVIGSVADKIIRGTKVPALVVPGADDAPGAIGGPVLVGVDGSDVAEAGLSAARELAAKLGLEIVIARAYSVPAPVGVEFAGYQPDMVEAYEEGAKSYLDKVAGPGEKTLLMLGPAAQAIEEAAKSEGAGLVVVTSQGKGLAARIALGSTTDRLVHSLDRPILVVPIHKD